MLLEARLLRFTYKKNNLATKSTLKKGKQLIQYDFLEKRKKKKKIELRYETSQQNALWRNCKSGGSS